MLPMAQGQGFGDSLNSVQAMRTGLKARCKPFAQVGAPASSQS